MMKYVLGYVFSTYGTSVLLIKKNRPAYQKGLLNGLGGKIESGETPLEAIRREVKEEAGLRIYEWDLCLTRTIPDVAEIQVFRSFSENIGLYKSMEDEEVFLVPVSNIHRLYAMPSVKWEIPLLLSKDVVFPISVTQERSGG